MQLDTLKVSSAKVEAGQWIKNIPEMADLELKVRGLGNSDYRRLQTQLIKAVPRTKRLDGTLDAEEGDRITITLLLETVLLDWRGLTDSTGAAIPYDKAMATKLLTDPDFRRFREAVGYAAALVGEVQSEELEADTKN